MEDLKDRYYSSVRKLLVGRTPESAMTAAQLEQYNSYKWDKGVTFRDSTDQQLRRSNEKHMWKTCTNGLLSK